MGSDDWLETIQGLPEITRRLATNGWEIVSVVPSIYGGGNSRSGVAIQPKLLHLRLDVLHLYQAVDVGGG